MKKKNKNTIGTIVSIVLVLHLLAGAIVAIVKLNGNINSTLNPFYITVDGVKISDHADKYALSCYTPLNVEVNNSFLSVSTQKKEYSVKVIPSGIADFTFTLEGEDMKFSDETDLTLGFDITPTENGFTFAPKGSVLTILSAVYPDSDIDIKVETYDVKNEYYTLVVTSAIGKEVKIDFAVSDDYMFEKNGIKLDKSEIIF